MSEDAHISEFGAVPGGRTVNTVAIQHAIDTCHEAGGGRVVCGPGTWCTGALELKSHVELWLARGCRLLGSPSLADYRPLTAEGFRAENAPEQSSHSLIRAVGAEDIGVCGPGTIDGNGLAFYDMKPGDSKLDKPGRPRPRIGMFYRCRDVRIQDVTLRDSACWSLWLMQCENVGVHRITVRGNRRMRNVDGIDIDACRDVTVSDCRMDTEDDCLVLRSIQRCYATPAVCENVTVSNCVLRTSCQGVRVGCPGDGVIRNATFASLVIHSTGNGILFQNPHRYLPPDNRGSADIGDIIFSNVVIDCHRTPVALTVEDGIALRRLGDITFSDLRIRSGGPCVVQGSKETIIRNVRFSNVVIATTGEDAVKCRHCAGVRLDNVELSNTPG